MSIQSEAERIKANVAATYAAAAELGAEMPDAQNSDNLSKTVAGAKAVLYAPQELTAEQQAQARNNIGAASADTVSRLSKEIADLEDKIPSEVGGLTAAQVNALDGMFKIASFTKDPTAEYTVFKAAFGIEDGGTDEPDEPEEPDTPTKTLTGISATYSGGEVAVGTALTDLIGIVVTATYSDGSTKTVTGYTLSGEIAEGDNIITVSYGGKTTTFTVTGIAENEEAVIYNVFDGEYENTGYSGTLQEQYGSNINVYKTKVDVTGADKVYWRIARTGNAIGAWYSNGNIGVYTNDDTCLGVINISDASVVTTEEQYGEIVPNVGYGVIETLSDGTEIRTKNVGSISLADYSDKSYILFACRPSSSGLALSWDGTAQSTSLLTLEGWV